MFRVSFLTQPWSCGRSARILKRWIENVGQDSARKQLRRIMEKGPITID
jgi:hypothetical protein